MALWMPPPVAVAAPFDQKHLSVLVSESVRKLPISVHGMG